MNTSKLQKLLVALFIMVGVCLFVPEGSEVQAASKSSTDVHYEEMPINEYRSGDEYIAPKPKEAGYEDWIFAGWFKEMNETKAISKTTKTGTYYAKFVPAEVLSVKCQVQDETKAGQEGNSKMRIISTIDSKRYNKVGFDIAVEGREEPINYESATVAKSIVARNEGVDYDYSPNIFDLKSNYFITVTITNIPSDYFDNGFFIRPYWVTKDNTKVYGVERYARVEDYYLDIVNVPVRLYSDQELTAGSATVEYDSTYFTYADSHSITQDESVITTPGYVNGNLYSDLQILASDGQVKCSATTVLANKADGTFVHLRFKTNDTTIFKKNNFNVSIADANNEEITNITAPDVIYSHYNSTYSGEADTSWYSENDKEFVITSPGELYGLAKLVNTDGDFLSGKTIYLGTNISVNKVAEDGTIEQKYPWIPIGWSSSNTSVTNAFLGVFDGQNHEISGIYATTTASTINSAKGQIWYVGLFGVTNGATIKNLKLTDSYFSGTYHIGSIIGRGFDTTISNIYSEATVVSNDYHAGGIVGTTDVGTFQNCWFAGSVTTSNTKTGYIGGMTGFVSAGEVTFSDCLNSGRDSYIQGNQHVGGIVGLSYSSTIDTVYSNADVVGTIASGSTNTGGVVGYQVKGVVSKAWFDGNVEGTGNVQYVGGVVGRIIESNGGVIDNCLSSGKVKSGRTTTISNNAYIGGILGGATQTVTISNCFSVAKEVSTAGATGCVGSVLGGTTVSGVTVSNCYAAEDSCNGVGLGSDGAGTPSGTPTILEQYTSYHGYMDTDLDFDNIWVAMKDAAPALQSFAEEEDKFDTTSWYTKAADDKENNEPGTEENPYIIDTIAEMYVFYPMHKLKGEPTIDPYSYAYCCCVLGDKVIGTVISEQAACDYLTSRSVEPWGGAGIKDEATVDLAIERGVTLITCNNPDVVLELLRQKGKRAK